MDKYFKRRFPYYFDDSDYQTNAPSYYDDLARKQKLIQLLAEKIWEYENTLDSNLENINNILNDYIDIVDGKIELIDLKIGENFNEEINALLVQWVNDGTLDHIINVEIFNTKADIEYVNDEIDLVRNNLDKITVLLPDSNNIDDTDMIQNVLDNVSLMGGGTVLVQNQTYYVKTDKHGSGNNFVYGIKIPDNIYLKLSGNSKFIAIPNNSPSYAIFQIMDVKNVTIEGGTIEGDKYDHIGTDGEWGHGITIINASDITIKNVTIKNFFGDGIYIRNSSLFKNVMIDNNKIERCRRHEITVIECKGLSITNNELIKDELLLDGIVNTSYGGLNIDLESNDNLSVIEDVVIENNVFTSLINTAIRFEKTSLHNKNIKVLNNTFNGSTHNAIDIYNCISITVEGNNAEGLGINGKGLFNVDNSNNVTIKNNRLKGHRGVYVANSSNLTIDNNEISDTNDQIIFLDNVKVSSIINNTLRDPGISGNVGNRTIVNVTDSDEITILNNKMSGSESRIIYVSRSNTVLISKNIITECLNALNLRNSTNCIIESNHIFTPIDFNGTDVIVLQTTTDSLVSNNIIKTLTSVQGIRLISTSENNFITGNMGINVSNIVAVDSSSPNNTEINNYPLPEGV